MADGGNPSGGPRDGGGRRCRAGGGSAVRCVPPLLLLRREGGRAPSMGGRSSCPERQELMPGPDALYLAPPPAEKKFRHIDIVVFNAAANTNIESILDTKESALDNLWEIIVKASILLVQAAAPHLSNGSSVILISSIAGFHPQASMAMYGVTRTALLGLNKALATEMDPDTRVNCIAPGFVPTHFAHYIWRNESVKKAVEEQTLLNRLGTTHDVATAAAFLASDDAAYITGETCSLRQTA